MGVQTALDAVRDAPGIVEAIRLADDLAFEAGRDPGVRTLRVLATALNGDDQVAAIAAVHALAEIFDEQAARMLTGLLSDDRPTIREHAAWALGSVLPRFDAMGRLIGQVSAGGFTGMLAQRTLEKWSSTAAETLAVSLETALQGTGDPGARARLVETLGLVRPAIATRLLLQVAGDDARRRRCPRGGDRRPRPASRRRGSVGGARRARERRRPAGRSGPARPDRPRRRAQYPRRSRRGPHDRPAVPARRHRSRRWPRSARATTAASRRCSSASATPSSPTRAPASSASSPSRAARSPRRPKICSRSDRRRPATSTAGCRCFPIRCRRPPPGRCGSPRAAASVASSAPPGRSTCCTCGWPMSAASPQPTSRANSASRRCSPSPPTRTP